MNLTLDTGISVLISLQINMAMAAIPSICAEYYSNLRYSYCSFLPSATNKYENDCANFHTKSTKLLHYGFTFSYLLRFVNTIGGIFFETLDPVLTI